ncbi:hypothetical protein F4808DRAFT_468211 [Astrocystis sublimbata]|nr:hypothetical protein F4808DRAFT_468211 [Astrocystis sublimbata]
MPATEWPFSRQLKLQDEGGHPVLLGVAGQNELEDVVNFAANTYFEIRQASIFTIEQMFHADSQWVKQRFRSSLKAVMDCCNAGEMTGVVLKIEHQGAIKGIMVLHLARKDAHDPWSINAKSQSDMSTGSNPVSMSSAHITLIKERTDTESNQLRPIINVPHVIASVQGRFMHICLNNFMSMLTKISHHCQLSALVSSHEGSYHTMYKTMIAGVADFIEKKGIARNDHPGPKHHETHGYSVDDHFFYERVVEASDEQKEYRSNAGKAKWNGEEWPEQPVYFDQAIRDVFDNNHY